LKIRVERKVRDLPSRAERKREKGARGGKIVECEAVGSDRGASGGGDARFVRRPTRRAAQPPDDPMVLIPDPQVSGQKARRREKTRRGE
jgi:hypothetical protein